MYLKLDTIQNTIQHAHYSALFRRQILGQVHVYSLNFVKHFLNVCSTTHDDTLWASASGHVSRFRLRFLPNKFRRINIERCTCTLNNTSIFLMGVYIKDLIFRNKFNLQFLKFPESLTAPPFSQAGIGIKIQGGGRYIFGWALL